MCWHGHGHAGTTNSVPFSSIWCNLWLLSLADNKLPSGTAQISTGRHGKVINYTTIFDCPLVTTFGSPL